MEEDKDEEEKKKKKKKGDSDTLLNPLLGTCDSVFRNVFTSHHVLCL